MKICNISNQPVFGDNTNTANKEKTRALIGSIIGTTVPLVLQMKKQGVKNPLKLTYGIKDMVVLSAGSVAGGVVGGSVCVSKERRTKKFKEGVFQFFNAVIPTLFVGGVMKIQENTNCLRSVPLKIAGVVGGIIAGMYTAVKLSNKIFDPKDKIPDRKIGVKDCVASADELIGALVIAKFPLIDKLHADKILPLVYSYCGYRAGSAK